MKTKKMALYVAFAVAFGLTTISLHFASAGDYHVEVNHDLEFHDQFKESIHKEVEKMGKKTKFEQFHEQNNSLAGEVKADDPTLHEVAQEKKGDAELDIALDTGAERKVAIQQAIENKDYDAFVQEVKKHDDMKDRDSMTTVEGGDEDGIKPIGMHEKTMKAHYNMLVQYYEDYGVFPDTHDVKRRPMHKERKYFTASDRSVVYAVMEYVDEQLLENALIKLERSLLLVKDEKTRDMLEGIKEVVMEVIEE